jgi:hypothetical protein
LPPRGSVDRFLRAVKETCGCIDCGRREGVLHFDHRPGTAKEFEPSFAPTVCHALLEIAKCDVRCASCHGYRHARAA